MSRQSFTEQPADRITQLKLPERAAIASPNVRQADLDLLGHTRDGFIDTTHFDTVRFPPPAWAVEKFSDAARDGALAYTGYRGHAGALEKVAKNVEKFLGVSVDPEQNIMFTPGTQGALFSVLAARINAGDRVAVMDPDYLFSARILRFLGADVGYVPLIEVDGLFTIDLSALENEFAQHGAKHLVFSHPNNPTGATFSKSCIASVAVLARHYGVTVTVDELYSRLVYDDAPFHHLAALDGMMEQTATLLGPSKTESLSGYRLGVLVGSADLMLSVENALAVTALRAPAYAQHLLPHWLGPDNDWVNGRIKEFASLRDLTMNKLAQLPWLDVKPQGGTAYLWPDVSPLAISDSELATAFIKQANVLISPGYQFGPQANGRFRICYAREDQSWAAALDQMVDIMDGFAQKQGLPSKITG